MNNVDVTSCSHSQGWPIVRVTMSAVDRQREAEAEDAAENHQRELEPVQRPPLQMTLPLRNELVGDCHLAPRLSAAKELLVPRTSHNELVA